MSNAPLQFSTITALRYHRSIPRLVLTKILGSIHRAWYVAFTSPLRLEQLPSPQLPSPEWVRVKPRLVGICGSDVKQVQIKGSIDNPLTALLSFPHVLGHEVVGEIIEVGAQVRTLSPRQRVVINPWLSCTPRGIQPVCPACAAGDYSLCQNFDQGILPPALHLGNNALAPGAFSTAFICHASQCFPLPDEISDEAAVLADPASVALHAILRHPPDHEEASVLVIGLGVIGQISVSILRKLYPRLTIYAIGRYPHQRGKVSGFGADRIFSGKPDEWIPQLAQAMNIRLHHPWVGSPWMLDGVDCIYDTIGSPESVAAALRVVRPRGKIVIEGVEAPERFEWTPLYFKEVQLIGANAFGVETFQGKRQHAMQIYLQLVSQGLDLSSLITHRYPLKAWKSAFQALFYKKRSGAIKVVFDFRL